MATAINAKALCTCRLCHTEKESKHCIGIEKNLDLFSRINRLLEIPIYTIGDGLPTMVYRNCRDRFVTIESK